MLPAGERIKQDVVLWTHACHGSDLVHAVWITHILETENPENPDLDVPVQWFLSNKAIGTRLTKKLLPY